MAGVEWVPCIDTTEVLRNKTICTSRSFGEMVSDLESLKAAVATFASSCANKLRGQGSCAKSVSTFICSNRFREDLMQYGNMAETTLQTPSSDTLEITGAALRVLESIYLPGIQYKRAGVIVSDIVSAGSVQYSLFDPIDNRTQRNLLMETIDDMNHRYGLKTVQLCVEGAANQSWRVKCDHRSPNYLTNLNEILTVNA